MYRKTMNYGGEATKKKKKKNMAGGGEYKMAGGGEYREGMKEGGRPGLWANIHAKRARIKAGSGERMRDKGDKGAPTAANMRAAQKGTKKRKTKNA
jgi:hypothetical protein|tara:strand:+ start:4315 stop:4602 length:288 start_codon:yes stop_codon:yes gene_type:complete